MDGYIDTYMNGWIGERGRKSFATNLFFFFNLCLALELGKKKKIFPDREGT